MNRKIAVLGAGPMGLAVAYQLALDGYSPVIYEADNRIGGMSASFDFEGTFIERYYHFHCIHDQPLLGLLKELGIQDKMHWKETKMGYWFQKRLQKWGNPFALLSFKGLNFISKIRYGLFAYICTRRKNWKPLDRLKAKAWIIKWVGINAWNVLWKPLFELKLHHYTEIVSAAWIWSRINRIGRSRYNIFREKLGYIEGGSETLLKAIEAEIKKRGGEIRLSSPVSKVLLKEGKVKGLKIGEQFEEYDQVISTIPLPYIPKLIPDLPPSIIKQYESVDNVAVVCIIVKLAQSLTENFWLNTSDPEMDIPGIIEYTNLYPMDTNIIYVPYYMPEDHPFFKDPDDAFFDKVKRYFKVINPLIQDEDFLALKAHRYRYSQPVNGPGYLETIPPIKLPVEGLWVADTSYYYPYDRGISESIELGRKIARDALAYKK